MEPYCDKERVGLSAQLVECEEVGNCAAILEDPRAIPLDEFGFGGIKISARERSHG